MNSDEARNIQDAWGLAMYFYNGKSNGNGPEGVIIQHVYEIEYQRWQTIWQTLVDLTM